MSKAHRTIGYLFIVVFLGTGVYMRATLPPPEQDDMGERMSRRAIHVYILLSALLNVVASSSVARVSPDSGETATVRPVWKRRLAGTGSLLLFIAPPIFLIAFFVDPAPRTLSKAVTVVGAFATLIGSILVERLAQTRRIMH